MERDEDIMMRGTKQEMPGFRFRLLRPEKKRELWNPDFELLFLPVSYTHLTLPTNSRV